MKVLDPANITHSDLISYNVPLDTPIWSVDTTYSKGDIVTLDDCGAVRYESLVNNNIGNDPSTDDGTNWFKLDEPANYYAMFDQEVSTQTVGDLATDSGAISITLNAEYISGLGFINVSCETIDITVTDSVEGVLFTDTIEMRDYGVDNWWEWYFKPFGFKNAYLNTTFPKLRTGTISVTFTPTTGEVAKVGAFIYGDAFDAGETLIGVSTQLKDFSRVEQDDFGKTTIVKRAKSKLASYPVLIPLSRYDDTFKKLSSLSGKICLWIPSDTNYSEATVLGFYRDLELPISSHAGINATLLVTGVR